MSDLLIGLATLSLIVCMVKNPFIKYIIVYNLIIVILLAYRVENVFIYIYKALYLIEYLLEDKILDYLVVI